MGVGPWVKGAMCLGISKWRGEGGYGVDAYAYAWCVTLANTKLVCGVNRLRGFGGRHQNCPNWVLETPEDLQVGY